MAAGTIPLSGTQRFDMYGNPLNGGALYIIAAGTVSTPQDAFADVALTIKMPYPMSLDAAGNIPFFFLDNTINAGVKIRLQDKNGVVQLASDFVLIIGPAGGTGGGGGTTVDPSAIYQTGDIKPRYGVGVHPGAIPGWVRCNGLTIGSSTSGASMPEGARSECLALFQYLWNTDPNLAVSGGRGANAATDWGANKNIATPDWRGYALSGLDDMGNTAANRLGTFFANATQLGSAGGVPSMTIANANLPPYTPSGSVGVSVSGTAPVQGAYPGTTIANVAAVGTNAGSSSTIPLTLSPSGSFTGTAQAGNASTPFGIISPRKLCTLYIKQSAQHVQFNFPAAIQPGFLDFCRFNHRPGRQSNRHIGVLDGVPDFSANPGWICRLRAGQPERRRFADGIN